MSTDGFDNFASGWHDAERCQSPAVDYGLPIHKYFVLAITTVGHIDIDPQVASELRRQPGGVIRHSRQQRTTTHKFGSPRECCAICCMFFDGAG
jgi:hypothetical protein